MKALHEKLYDATARMDRVILLAGAMGGGESFPDDLNDFFDEEDAETIAKFFGEIPDFVDIDAHGYQHAEDIYEWLFDSGKLGYLIKFSTPVMTPHGEDCQSFSWGYYNSAWVYADTLDEAIEKGLAWVAKRRADEDAKATTKGGAA